MMSETLFPPSGEAGLPSGNGITRPRLHRIMQEHTVRSGVDVRVGVTFTVLDDDGSKVTVETTDGESREYDLVIGADGLYSQVRQTIFPDAPVPKYTGQLCWRYNLPRIEGLDGIWTFPGPGGNTGLVPLADDLMYIFTTSTAPGAEPPRIEQTGIAAVYREHLSPFGGIVAEQRDLIVSDKEVVLRPLEAVLVPAPWHSGRVVIIGDAAHATTPHAAQGAAQALEDAITLADELTTADNVQDGLDGFIARRFETCKIVYEGSLAVGRWEQDPTLAIDPDAERMRVMQAAMVMP
jgi:2-polyprenyl-6-methoxyphenol hydroxylase-like FAD-dependent oxidoreductase